MGILTKNKRFLRCFFWKKIKKSEKIRKIFEKTAKKEKKC